MTARLLAAALVLFAIAGCRAAAPAEFDPTPYEQRVCDLLTPEQLARFRVTGPGVPGTPGPSCKWTAAETVIAVTFSDYTAPSQPAEYPTTINGVSARHDGIPGKGAQLACATTIDSRARTVTVVVYTPRDACAASDTIAGFVIDTARAHR